MLFPLFANKVGWHGNIVEADLDLALVREFLHLALNRIQDISVKSSVLKIMVIDNLLVVLAIGENTEDTP